MNKLRGVVCALAVTGTGGTPYKKGSNIDESATTPVIIILKRCTRRSMRLGAVMCTRLMATTALAIFPLRDSNNEQSRDSLCSPELTCVVRCHSPEPPPLLVVACASLVRSTRGVEES
eukprot:1138653-Pyramimonas_sp.AAC.2